MKEIPIVTVKDEDKISRPKRPIELYRYPKIDAEIAWELTNLIRIAATDFQCFDNWFNQKKGHQEFTLEKDRKLKDIELNNSLICVEKKIKKSVLDKYTLLDDKDLKNKDLIAQFPDHSYYKYKILKTYEYISYYPLELNVDLDRFGFIAERQKENNEKVIFIVFRGTREPAEWFSNVQFKQVNFLATKNDRKGIKNCGKISLGFNKIYTMFQPGLFIENKLANSILKRIDIRLQKLLRKINEFQIKEKSIHQAINDFFSNSLNGANASIYITGHSLGGALATIAAMDIAVNYQKSIHLYTFASPRVGDNNFADEFNRLVNKGLIKAFRFANSEDIVPKLPFPVWFNSGLNLDRQIIFKLIRNSFNNITRGIFTKNYQHVGVPIYFTHQALRKKNVNTEELSATIGDNHNMTSTYFSALFPDKDKQDDKQDKSVQSE